MEKRISFITAFLFLFIFGLTNINAQVTQDAPIGARPDAIINLANEEGVRLVKGQWRYSDAKVVEVDHKSVGADLKPSGTPNKTLDITPKAGIADFDDSKWQVIDAGSLDTRRGNGKLSFNWYRIKVTIPEKIANFDPTGSTAVFEIVVDDYAEIWVDGKLPLTLGQTGGHLIKGFNSPNRVVVARDVKPGQEIQLAVFGANGPLSNPPGNFIWIRSATLDFYKPTAKAEMNHAGGEIKRVDSGLNNIVSVNAKIEKVASGFTFTEGPVWIREGNYLLFSDPNDNKIYRLSQDGQVSVYMTKSGYTGFDIREYRQPGSNGLTLDKEGRLTINQHGNRRVVRQEKNGQITVLADKFEGKRLNSPNDLVYRSDGTLYFTDPFFGLPKFGDDPRKELPYTGVYSLINGQVKLVVKDLTGPNGIAFSPDEKYLYVGNWDDKKKIVMRYEVQKNGTLTNAKVFYDMTKAEGEDAIDGIKVDVQGNVYVSGPGGLWIFSADGKHLGTIIGAEHPHNMAWGDADGKTLYLCARSSIYRIRLNVEGVRP